MSTKRSVRTRVAPSPTGDPHVGTAYVALFNMAFAHKHGGQFVLRIEDTDQKRSRPESEAMIFEALAWLGISWDEGPDVGGPLGPYRQSERTEIYREHSERLVETGAAYACFCSKERLDAVRDEQRARKENPGYDGHCRSLSTHEARARRGQGEAHVVRLRMPREGEAVVKDMLRGDIRIPHQQLDDQVLLKSDGYPTYHLANVVDDHLMGITHVIRAEEWISSLPKHFQLYEAFGWDRPLFCHLPLLRNADRSKISKRKNPVNLNHYRRSGFLPEAIVNYLALMGWAMPDERDEFGVPEFQEVLDLEGISLGGPVFDLEKLTWLNGKYLRGLTDEQLLERLRAEPLADDYLLRVIRLARERIDTLRDFVSYASFFFTGEVDYDEAALHKLVPKKDTPAETAKTLRKLLDDELDALDDWTPAAIEARVRAFGERREWKPKELFMALRVATTGRPATPPLFETMAVLGKEICRHRLRSAIAVLRSMKAVE